MFSVEDHERDVVAADRVWFDPVGTITLETRTKWLFIVMVVSVVTKTWFAG